MQPSKTPLLTHDVIAQRVGELADTIARDYADKDLLLLLVLKGALVFGSDLMRRLPGRVAVDFVRARSYTGPNSSGQVRLLYTPSAPLADRHVLLVEDILDTGRTASFLQQHLHGYQLGSLRLVTLLDKPSRRENELTADYTGFTIDNQFVVGYGLDYEEAHRELPAIHVLDNGAVK
ncbi:MAG: hypoxanthine phosphoribosyltransferase [Candidatus Hydrogenedentota bacterium]